MYIPPTIRTRPAARSAHLALLSAWRIRVATFGWRGPGLTPTQAVLAAGLAVLAALLVMWIIRSHRSRACRRASPAPASEESLFAPRRVRALVVDDMPAQGALLRARLVLLSVDARQVANAQDAMRELQSNAYDVMLVDCQMPIIDGFELARQIRRHATRVPLLIAVSASTGPGHRIRCEQAGFDEVIDKPVTTADLAVLLARLRPGLDPGAPARCGDVLRDDLDASIRDDWSLIWAAQLQGNVGEVEYRAHRIKGAALLFGNAGLAEAAARIETCAAVGCMPSVGAFSMLKCSIDTLGGAAGNRADCRAP